MHGFKTAVQNEESVSAELDDNNSPGYNSVGQRGAHANGGNADMTAVGRSGAVRAAGRDPRPLSLTQDRPTILRINTIQPMTSSGITTGSIGTGLAAADEDNEFFASGLHRSVPVLGADLLQSSNSAEGEDDSSNVPMGSNYDATPGHNTLTDQGIYEENNGPFYSAQVPSCASMYD